LIFPYLLPVCHETFFKFLKVFAEKTPKGAEAAPYGSPKPLGLRICGVISAGYSDAKIYNSRTSSHRWTATKCRGCRGGYVI
jgi:hypothetical protein